MLFEIKLILLLLSFYLLFESHLIQIIDNYINQNITPFIDIQINHSKIIKSKPINNDIIWFIFILFLSLIIILDLIKMLKKNKIKRAEQLIN